MKLNEVAGTYYSRGKKAANDGREKYYLGGGYFATESDPYDFDTDTNYYYVYRLMDHVRLGTLTISGFDGHSIEIEVVGTDGVLHNEEKELDEYADMESALPWFKEQIAKFKKEGILE